MEESASTTSGTGRGYPKTTHHKTVRCVRNSNGQDTAGHVEVVTVIAKPLIRCKHLRHVDLLCGFAIGHEGHTVFLVRNLQTTNGSSAEDTTRSD